MKTKQATAAERTAPTTSQPPNPPGKRLTLTGLAIRMDVEFAAIRRELTSMRSQNDSRHARRTDDVRAMIKEEIADQTKTLTDEMRRFQDTVTNQLATMPDKDFQLKVAALVDQYDEQQRLQKERDAREARREHDANQSRPWLLIIFSVILGNQTQMSNHLPIWTFWAIVGGATLLVLTWPRVRRMLPYI